MKLPRLQLHLSTCIVLMFVAGGFIWKNLPQRNYIPQYVMTEQEVISYFTQGWPYIFRTPTEITDRGDIIYGRVVYAPLAANLFIAFAILAPVAFVCEWFLRRRRAQLRAKS